MGTPSNRSTPTTMADGEELEMAERGEVGGVDREGEGQGLVAASASFRQLGVDELFGEFKPSPPPPTPR